MEEKLREVVDLYFKGHSVKEALEIARKENGPFGEDPQKEFKNIQGYYNTKRSEKKC